jgi:hypothetical protein
VGDDVTLQNLFGDLALDASVVSLHDLLSTLGSRLQVAGVSVDGTHPLPVAGTFADANGVPYSNANPLPVDVHGLTVGTLNVAFPDSVVSTANSTSTPLLAGQTFTGTWEQVTTYSAISCIVLTDQASAINGALVDYSHDGVTVLRSVAATIPANTGLTFMFAPEARYFRLRYINGATNQTVFVGQTLLHYQTPTAAQLPLGATTTDVTLGGITSAHLRGRASTGQWKPVKINDVFGEVQVRDTGQQLDIFGLLQMGHPTNQVEVHLDDTNWSTYGNETKSGAGAGATQALGRVAFTAGTSANGTYRFVSTDAVKYIPGKGIYGMQTAAFTVPPTNAADRSYMWLLGDPTTGNGVAVGYKGTSFGVVYYRGGAEISFTPQASWSLSNYTLNGTAQTFNPALGQIYKVECGLLGYAGWALFVFSPDHRWTQVAQYNGLNVSDEPVFTNFDLWQYVEIDKTASDGTAPTIKSACWAGGTTSSHRRISDPLSDRTLADVVRSVAWGKATNGNYVPQAFNNNGRALVSNDAVGTEGAAALGSTTQVGGIDNAGNLQAVSTDTLGRVKTRDGFTSGEVLADQTGAAAVLTFTFAGGAVDLIWVTDTSGSTSAISRVDPFGGTPSASLGIPVLNQTPTPITCPPTASVQVYAPAGTNIVVYGLRY